MRKTKMLYLRQMSFRIVEIRFLQKQTIKQFIYLNSSNITQVILVANKKLYIFLYT